MKTKKDLALWVVIITVFSASTCFATPQSPQPYSVGLLVQNQLYVSGTIGWYNNTPSSLPMAVATQSITAGAINVGTVQDPAHTVAVVGHGGDPATVIAPGDISKFSTVYVADGSFTLPPVMVPSGLTNIGALTGTAAIGISGMRTGYRTSSINLANNGDTITINGNVTLYVTGDINLTGHFAGITITPGSSLALYAGGNIDGDSQLSFNSLAPDAKRLQIYGLPTCTNINWHNDVDLYGTIYAPNANITMDNNCNFYGAVMANSFFQSSGGSFNYDASLVPEPATLLLLGLGAVMLRKRKQK